MNARGQYGRREHAAWNPRRSAPRPIVGITLFHGVGDRDTAASQLNAQILSLARAVVSAAGGNPALITTTHEGAMDNLKDPKFASKIVESRDAINRSPYRALWDDAVSPLFDEWVAFYGDRKHWYDAVTEVFTSWEDYKAWFDRVADLRKKVQAAGIGTAIPVLQPLHKSLQETVEHGAEKVATGIGDAWSIIKYGLIGVLAIGGVVALSSVAQNLRTGRDPAEKYVDLIRDRRRAAARAALPPSAPLALPPGEFA